MINENSHKKKCLDIIQFVWSVYARTMESSKQNCQMDYSFFLNPIRHGNTLLHFPKEKKYSFCYEEKEKRRDTHGIL